MDKSIKKFIFIFFVCLFFILNCSSQSPIVTNQENVWTPKQNSSAPANLDHGTLAEKCPEGMLRLFYGNKNLITWICDCQDGYLYFAQTGCCYAAYKRGPCNEKEYLILSKEAKMSNCENNPCIDNGLVSVNGTCHQLDQKGPCMPFTLTVDPKTFELACILNRPVGSGHKHNVIGVPQNPCPSGGRRDSLGLCRTPL